MNQIEKRLKERGHSKPEVGLKNIKIEQKSLGIDADEFLRFVREKDDLFLQEVRKNIDYDIDELNEPGLYFISVDWSTAEKRSENTIAVKVKVGINSSESEDKEWDGRDHVEETYTVILFAHNQRLFDYYPY